MSDCEYERVSACVCVFASVHLHAKEDNEFSRFADRKKASCDFKKCKSFCFHIKDFPLPPPSSHPPSSPPPRVASQLRKSLTVSGVCGGTTHFFLCF